MEQEMVNLLKELATQLGTTTEYLWAVTIKQAYIQAYVSLIVCLFPLVAMVGWASLVFYCIKKKVDGDLITILCIVGLIALLASCALWGTHIPQVIAGFYNPEYWALDNILSHLK